MCEVFDQARLKVCLTVCFPQLTTWASYFLSTGCLLSLHKSPNFIDLNTTLVIFLTTTITYWPDFYLLFSYCFLQYVMLEWHFQLKWQLRIRSWVRALLNLYSFFWKNTAPFFLTSGTNCLYVLVFCTLYV